MRLHYQVQGGGSPLLALHGFLGSLDNWRAMSKRLAQHHRVYTIDLRNHGASPHDPVMNYRVMAEDLRDFFVDHDLSSAHLLGHSMGGKVAMQFALSFPTQVEKLVIVDIAPRAYAPEHRPLLDALLRLPVQTFATYAEIDAALAPSVPDTALRQFLSKNLLRNETGGFRWRIALDAISKNYDQLTQAIETTKPFTKPTLFIRAVRSRFIQDSDNADIRKMFSNAEIVMIADAGHWVHIDAAEGFYQVVTQFLAQAKPQ